MKHRTGPGPAWVANTPLGEHQVHMGCTRRESEHSQVTVTDTQHSGDMAGYSQVATKDTERASGTGQLQGTQRQISKDRGSHVQWLVGVLQRSMSRPCGYEC